MAIQFVYEGVFALYKTVGEGSPSDVTADLTLSYSPDSSGQFLMRRTGTSIQVVSLTGIIIQASWYGKYMDLRMDIPGRYRRTSRVRGIYGNFDGDSTNDFAYRNEPNVPLSNNINDHQIFDIIQTCKKEIPHIICLSFLAMFSL